MRRENVCPDCWRCTYVFMVARLGLLQAVRGFSRLWELGALLRGAICACR